MQQYVLVIAKYMYVSKYMQGVIVIFATFWVGFRVSNPKKAHSSAEILFSDFRPIKAFDLTVSHRNFNLGPMGFSSITFDVLRTEDELQTQKGDKTTQLFDGAVWYWCWFSTIVYWINVLHCKSSNQGTH